jgi:hypothetical protein
LNINRTSVIKGLGINREGSVAFAPTWSAHNAVAKRLVDDLLNKIEYVPSGVKTDAKYQLTIASILALSTAVLSKPDGVLALSKDRQNWGAYDVGADTIFEVFRLLELHGFISFVPNSGQRHFYYDDNGKQKWLGILSQYDIADTLYALEDYDEARWVETGRPAIMIGKPETRGAGINRKKMGIKKPKLAITTVKDTYGRRYSKASTGVKLLGRYWQKHPLELPPSSKNFITPFGASATRIYHNGRMDSGGRYYGAWTNISSNHRLAGSIDDEPLVEIDLNAAQPTLFSSMLGYTMEVPDTWSDLYAEMIRNLGDIDTDIAKRKKMKQCVVEVIGTGNIAKQHPALDTGVKWKDVAEWEFYRLTLAIHVPALSQLDRKYYNGAGFISYHESEIMTEVLHDLMIKNVVAYPVHDCLLVKKIDQEIAIDTYRTIMRNYILRFNRSNETSKVDITTPVSVEELGKAKRRLAGHYS